MSASVSKSTSSPAFSSHTSTRYSGGVSAANVSRPSGVRPSVTSTTCRRSRRIANSASASRRSGGTTGSGRISVAGIRACRAGPVLASTSLMCTKPTTRPLSLSTTGNRDSPVLLASCSNCAGVTSSVTVVTDDHRRITSAAVRSCSASAPLIRACSSWSSRPSVRACATSPASSPAV